MMALMRPSLGLSVRWVRPGYDVTFRAWRLRDGKLPDRVPRPASLGLQSRKRFAAGFESRSVAICGHDRRPFR